MVNVKQVALVTCFAALAVASVASAQVTAGAQAGLAVANMSMSGVGGPLPGYRNGPAAGVFVEFPFANRLAIRPEALIAVKGLAFSVTRATGTATYSLRLTYLDIPVLLRIDLRGAARVVPYACAGPNLGFLLRAREIMVTPTERREGDMRNWMLTTDFGLALGGGVRVRRMFGEVRYVHGLKNVYAYAGSDGHFRKTNHVVEVIGGLRF